MFLFHDTATTEIYTYRHPLSLHDALPIDLGCRQRPLRHHADMTRKLEAGELAAAVLDQLVLGRGLAFRQLDESRWHFDIAVVRNAHHLRKLHRRMGLAHRLDLGGGDIFTAPLPHVIGPARNHHRPLRYHHSHSA